MFLIICTCIWDVEFSRPLSSCTMVVLMFWKKYENSSKEADKDHKFMRSLLSDGNQAISIVINTFLYTCLTWFDQDRLLSIKTHINTIYYTSSNIIRDFFIPIVYHHENWFIYTQGYFAWDKTVWDFCQLLIKKRHSDCCKKRKCFFAAKIWKLVALEDCGISFIYSRKRRDLKHFPKELQDYNTYIQIIPQSKKTQNG